MQPTIRQQIQAIDWDALPGNPPERCHENPNTRKTIGLALAAISATSLSIASLTGGSYLFVASTSTIISMATAAIITSLFGLIAVISGLLIILTTVVSQRERNLAQRQRLGEEVHEGAHPKYIALESSEKDGIITNDELNTLIRSDLQSMSYNEFLTHHGHNWAFRTLNEATRLTLEGKDLAFIQQRQAFRQRSADLKELMAQYESTNRPRRPKPQPQQDPAPPHVEPESPQEQGITLQELATYQDRNKAKKFIREHIPLCIIGVNDHNSDNQKIWEFIQPIMNIILEEEDIDLINKMTNEHVAEMLAAKDDSEENQAEIQKQFILRLQIALQSTDSWDS